MSYFVGLEADEGKPRTILAGDRSLLINNRIVTGPVTATTNDSVSIRDGFHPGFINIAFGDGSAQQLSADEFRNVVEKENELPLRFVIP